MGCAEGRNMRAVKRWRYYCDFCKKAGQSGFHMAKHEKSCTLNPARECRMCVKLAEGSQADMSAMLAILPDPAAFMKTFPEEREWVWDSWEITPGRTGLDDEAIRAQIVIALPMLRELTHDCPVCIMAAFRQKKIPLPLVDAFNFTKEMESLWADINSEREESYY
jgi:hypothetical protein